ncbi:MAG: hypothetical protein AB7F96_15310 [Beijerinckiaceae bacterium]
MTRDVLFFDLALLALNAIFVAIVYFAVSRSAAASAGSLDFAHAAKVVVAISLWAAGNTALLLGLVGAMRRTGTLR